MEKHNYNLSDSLEKAIDNAVVYTKGHNLKEINLETLVYYCLDDESLKGDMSGRDIEELPQDVRKLFRSIAKLNFKSRLDLVGRIGSLLKPKSTSKKEPIVDNLFSPALTIVFENMTKNKKKQEGANLLSKKSFDDTLGIDDLFLSILSTEDITATEEDAKEFFDVFYGLVECGIDLSDFGGTPSNGALPTIKKVASVTPNEDEDFKKMLGQIRDAAEELMKSSNGDDEDEWKEDGNPLSSMFGGSSMERAGSKSAVDTKKSKPGSKTPSLDKYAVEMTGNAKSGKFDPVIGRDKEIEQIIEILCCRKKNNAVLTGDPGCGKTAIIESLANRIISGNVPLALAGKKIYSLDLNSLVSGTQYRGQYEQRLQSVIKEVTTNPDIIVYIDEIHNLIGNGSTSGSGDGANILKPYLARGEFQCIGSTTTDEYRKFIEKDGALKRRFSPVLIEEPGVEDTKEILKGLAPVYGNYHGTTYSDEVLERCVDWSGKYINDRFFPDKAISVLDMASSMAKLENQGKAQDTNLMKLEKEIDRLNEEKRLAVLDSRFEDAAVIRDTVNNLQKDLEKEKELIKEAKPSIPVTISHVSSVISKLSNVPVDNILSSDIEKIRTMRTELSRSIIGQDEAVREVTLALQRNIFGLRDPKKPIASFLFVGPTGTGKTLISKLVAKEFMGSESNLITIACSEYMQDWAESKLLGSAPGYVGYTDSEPRLYVLKRKPYSVILIDEVEKSSSNLYNIWLNMLEEGEITLSSGEKVSCRNSIIIFTGNVGTKALELKGNGLGFTIPSAEEKKKQDVSTVMAEVRKEFRPEFLNRISKVVVFNSLTEENLKQIFFLEFEKLRERIKESQGFDIELSDKIIDLIVSKCEPKYGARSLQRLITEYIEDSINIAMLDQNISGKSLISLDLPDEKVGKDDVCSEDVKVEFLSK